MFKLTKDYCYLSSVRVIRIICSKISNLPILDYIECFQDSIFRDYSSAKEEQSFRCYYSTINPVFQDQITILRQQLKQTCYEINLNVVDFVAVLNYSTKKFYCQLNKDVVNIQNTKFHLSFTHQSQICTVQATFEI
ncbi:Hypothetical_protein [Hexamita inflata]|uniref:Hypothetical_protein n=1 Tax=Hexamita inflata TaxID=28002 RepID=A0AA86QUK1_9EUKA|nr:Hypothetical protein HINF_LOCUS48652 [Hexamita inflata]